MTKKKKKFNASKLAKDINKLKIKGVSAKTTTATVLTKEELAKIKKARKQLRALNKKR